MIVVICNMAVPSGGEHASGHLLDPEQDLLGRPYIDRLAERYRSFGATDVMWSDAHSQRAGSAPWRPFDPQALSNCRQLVLAADVGFWPGEDIRRLLRSGRRGSSSLTAIVRHRAGKTYSELIDSTGSVVRRYDQPVECTELLGPF